MINKNYLIFAVAIALASCSVDEYMGENPEFTQTTKENIIGFGGGTGSMSRATQNSGDDHVMLDKHFKVYGCKSTSTSGTYQTVFNNYWVWYEDAITTSNSNKWEYVGDKNQSITGNDNIPVGPLPTAQYIKYWDYSADHYRFVAGTPQSQVIFTVDNKSNVTGATVTGLAGHISPSESATSKSKNPVYISAPIQINKTNSLTPKYGDAVPLTFTRLQTKVRVGIYETIPGYKIESIEFYKYDLSSTSSDKFSIDGTYKKNVILTSTSSNYFNGGANVNATVNYNWTGTKPSYSVIYANGGTDTGYDPSNNWYGGKFEGVKAKSSNPTAAPSESSTIIKDLYGEDNDMDNNGYFTVLSTTKEASALVIKCDFTLKSEDTEERINVYGATAAIPAEYCKWDDNKMYTYIFKISQETNGNTGDPTNPGLIPITFDAFATATKEGVETIVQTPSITTHQTGSVVDNGGIVFIKDKPIEITVTNKDGVLQNLNENISPSISTGYIAVYNLGSADENAKTEAELTVTAPSGPTEHVTLSIEGEGSQNNKATFEPSTAGWYAIQYHNGTTYFYKVIKVENNLP